MKSKSVLKEYMVVRMQEAMGLRKKEQTPFCLSPFGPDNRIEPLQIRQMADTVRQTYVFVVEPWDEGWLVCPLSRLHGPLTDREWDDGNGHMLQIWGIRTLSTETLRRSWPAGKLPEGTARDVLDLFSMALTGYQPDSRLLEGLGDAPADSAIVKRYLEEEMKNFSSIDQLDDLLL